MHHWKYLEATVLLIISFINLFLSMAALITQRSSPHSLSSSSETKNKSEETRQLQPMRIVKNIREETPESFKNNSTPLLARAAIGREARTRFGKISCSPIQS